MNDLHQAYEVFRLPIGAPWETVKRRYKRLASVWHPDRAASEDARIDMEEDLKVINNAFDAFKKHFEGGQHTADAACRCQPRQQGKTDSTEHRSGPGTGPGPQKTRPQDGDNATEEARRNAAEDLAYKTAMESLRRQQRQRKLETVRWISTAACGIVFILLCGFGSFGSQLKSWCHGTPSDAARSDTDTTTRPGTTISTTPSVAPPYTLLPTINSDGPPQQQEHDQMRHDEEAKTKKEQEIYFAKLEIDRHQKAVQQCETNITNIDAQLANPTLSYAEKSKLEDLRSFRQRTLQQEQAGLESAHANLRELDATANTTTPEPKPTQPDGPSIPLVPIPETKNLLTPEPTKFRFGPPLDPDSPQWLPTTDDSGAGQVSKAQSPFGSPMHPN